MLPANATPEEVLTLQYFQWQESIRLKNYRAVLEERKKQASISSARRRALSTSSTGRNDPANRSRFINLGDADLAAVTRTLNPAFVAVDAEGVPIPTEPAGALMTLGTYLRTIEPPAGDPKRDQHLQLYKQLAIAAQAIQQPQATPRRDTDRDRRSRSPRGRSSRKSSRRHRSSRSHSRRSYSSSSDSEAEIGPCGALCFTRRIREARMPKKFSLATTPKFNCKQEPSGWLEDYRLAVGCQRGTTTTAMQYIQLMMEGTARD